MTFISRAFQKLLLRENGVKLEDLVFRKLDTSNAYEQYESSEEESQNGDKEKSMSLNKTQKKHIDVRQSMYEAWEAKEAVLVNLKQIVDQWSPETNKSKYFFEVSNTQQLKKDRMAQLQAKRSSELALVPQNDGRFESAGEDSSPHHSPLMLDPFDINNRDINESAQQRLDRALKYRN